MTDAILVEGLRFAYPPLAEGQRASWVLDGVDLRVCTGEWLAVMGASDVGKSTLCLLIAGLAPHLTRGTKHGRVVVAGRNTDRHPPPALAGVVGYLFQEADAQLFNPTVETEIAWGLENLGLPVAEMRARIDESLALLRLEGLRYRSPVDLSGGEKKRVALASVLAMHPSILVLDEPMGGLDPVGRQEVLSALQSLRELDPEQPVTIVMTESDPEAVASFADRLLVLGKPQPASLLAFAGSSDLTPPPANADDATLPGSQVIQQGSPRRVLNRVNQLIELGVAVPQMARLASDLNRRLGTEYRFVTVAAAQRALRPHMEGKACEPKRLPPEVVPGSHASSSMEDGRPALEARDVWHRYGEGSSPVLHGVSLRVPPGQLVALVGANGSGKTTLAKQFIGLLRPWKGWVSVAGQDAAGLPVGELARQVGYLFQHPEQQIFSPTVQQEVAFGPKNQGLDAAEVQNRVASALSRFDLEPVAEHPPAILSYGLRRRVTLAALAALDSPILILDEPVVGLDARERRETLTWLRELHGQGRTILLITHDMGLVAEHAQRVLVLDGGRLLADVSPSKLFHQPELLAQASLSPPPVVALVRALQASGLPSASVPDGAITIRGFVDWFAACVEGRL